MKGVIPANNYIDIEICFNPKSMKEEKTYIEDKDDKGVKDEKDEEEFVSKFEVR